MGCMGSTDSSCNKLPKALRVVIRRFKAAASPARGSSPAITYRSCGSGKTKWGSLENPQSTPMSCRFGEVRLGLKMVKTCGRCTSAFRLGWFGMRPVHFALVFWGRMMILGVLVLHFIQLGSQSEKRHRLPALDKLRQVQWSTREASNCRLCALPIAVQVLIAIPV